MPRRADTHLAYWLDMRGVLRGYPQKKRLKPRAVDAGDDEARLLAHSVLSLEDATWQDRLDDECGGRVVLAWRDRHGFRWQRTVGLHDYVAQADAAQLLGVSLMRVNRWVRKGGLLKAKRKKGLSVVRVKELYELAIRMRLKVPRGRPRGIIGGSEEENESRARSLKTHIQSLLKQAHGNPEELDRLMGMRRLGGKELAETMKRLQSNAATEEEEGG